MNCYCISGLGAGSEIFDNLQFPEGWSIRHLDWLEPEPDETFHHYVGRLSEGIDANQPFVLIGVSFGGMVAQELVTIVHPEKLILISSIQSEKGLPGYFRIGKYFPFKQLIRFFIPTGTNFILNRAFSVYEPAHCKALDTALRTTSKTFTNWAIQALLSWKPSNHRTPVFSIHGTKDRILPFGKSGATKMIQGGGHLMVLTHGKEVSEWLKKTLS